jgi:aminoglycoside/choline kinase family phosphotransferase
MGWINLLKFRIHNGTLPEKVKLWIPRTPSEIDPYLRQDLLGRLRVTHYETFSGHRVKTLAQSSNGRFLIKFFLSSGAKNAQRYVFVHSFLTRNSLRAPELIYFDTSLETRLKFNLSCVVTRWVQGSDISSSDLDTRCRAFQKLAKIHRSSVQGFEEGFFREYGWSFPRFDPSCIKNEVLLVVTQLRRGGMTISRAECSMVEKFMEEGLKNMDNSPIPSVLLHRDFHPGNVILTPEGNFVIIDFETSTLGNSTLIFLGPYISLPIGPPRSLMRLTLKRYCIAEILGLF